MKRTLGICLLICGLVACEKNSSTSSDSAAADLPPTRASALGDFADNPMLASVPSDTPYAFASFKPIPPEYIHKWSAMIGPMMAKLRTAPGGDADGFRAVADEIGTFDVKRFEELGFSAKARMVVYGLGVYPVLRVEISNGDRVFDFVQRVAKRWNKPLPPPTEQNGHRHWIIDNKDMSVLIGLTKTEIVLSLAPRAVLEQNLPLVLGDKKPAQSMTTAQFKDLAKRDGFNAQGVGFIDSARIIGAAMDVAGADKPNAACLAAIDVLAKHAPRLALGYDDFAKSSIAFGVVLELSPDVTSDMKSLTTKLAGIDRLLKERPVMGMAAAVDLSHVRALAPKVATVMRTVGVACQSPEISSAADKLETKLATALPPFLDGPTGAVFSLSDLKLGAMGPEKMDGYFVVHMKDASGLIQLASSQLPGLDLSTDGKAHALPSMIPFKGHVAAKSDAIALALGKDSSSKVTDVLGGKPSQAPLWLMVFDYARMGQLMKQDATTDASDLEMFKMFGLGVFQVGVDDRGLYTWMSIEMK